MKRISVGMLALGLLLASPAVYSKAVTITYWGVWSGVAGQAEKENVARFNKLYEGKIFVKAMDVGDVEQKALTAIAGGAAPDLFKLDRFRVGSWAAKDLLVCLDPLIKRDKYNMSQYYKPTYGETIYGGRCYALPWNTDSRGLYFNKTMFKQLGLDPNRPPKTWEELTATSRKIDMRDGTGKLTRATLIPVNGNWWFNGWLYSAGGNITTPNGRKCTWNSPEGLKALNYVNDILVKYGGIGKVGSAGDFWGGKCAMELNGSWALGDWKKNKNKKFELGAAPPPRPSGLEKEHKSWAGGFAMCLPRGSKHQKEAWEFMKWYTSNKDAMVNFGRLTGQIPALNSAARDPRFLEMDPLFDVFTEILPEAQFRTVVPCGAELWNLYAEGPAAIDGLIRAGKKSPADILATTQTQGQKVLDRAWARVRRL